MEVQEYPKIPLDDFLVELSFEFSGASPDMLAHYVRAAAIDFAARARVLLREVVIKLEACIPNYLIDIDDCMEVSAVVGVRYFRCGRFDPYRYFDACNCCSTCFPLRNITWKLPNIIWVEPPPVEDGSMMLKCYAKPKQDACEIDALFMTEYKDAILHGARYRIYNIRNRAWTSADAARVSQVEFERAIASARSDKLMAGRKGPLRVKTIYNRC